MLSTASSFVKKMHSNLKYQPSYIFIVSSLYLTLPCNKCFFLLNWKKLEIFVSNCPVSLFYLHLKIYSKNYLWGKSIRPSPSVFSILYFFREIQQIESIVLLYFEDIWRWFEKYLSKSNKNQLILLSQYIKCSNVSSSRY